MPKLWETTVDAHRGAVRDAVIEATAALVAARGLRGVTMAGIAEKTGIGRATLYKYFPGVEAILLAWHERHIAGHLQHLTAIADQPGGAEEKLRRVLEAYARIAQGSQSGHSDPELEAVLHRHDQVRRVRHQLQELLRGLLAEAAESGAVRGDIPPRELAEYCIHSLAAAGALRSTAALRRVVTVVLDGLRPRQELARPPR